MIVDQHVLPDTQTNILDPHNALPAIQHAANCCWKLRGGDVVYTE